MSYSVCFQGSLRFAHQSSMEKALQQIEEEDANPDDFEPNVLERSNFVVDTETLNLSINYTGFLPASYWYGCQRLIRKMAEYAETGEVKCAFEGDPDEWVFAEGL